MDYARPYRGDPNPLDLNEVVGKIAQQLSRQAEAQTTHLETSLATALPPVRADPEQLHQVFLNLGLNALQALGSGGRLGIETAVRPAVLRGAASAFVEVRFRDNGPGIPQGDLRNLFIPFFTTKDKGTGLGLPISQRIIQNHGGTIEVRSILGEGASFTTLLPVEADAYAAFLSTHGAVPPTTRDSSHSLPIILPGAE